MAASSSPSGRIVEGRSGASSERGVRVAGVVEWGLRRRRLGEEEEEEDGEPGGVGGRLADSDRERKESRRVREFMLVW